MNDPDTRDQMTFYHKSNLRFITFNSGITSSFNQLQWLTLTLRIRHDSELSKNQVPASRNNARTNQNGTVSFNQPVINSISTKKNHSPPNITIIKTDSNAGQLKVQSQLPLCHTLSDNKYPYQRDVDHENVQKFSKISTKNCY